MIRAFVLEFEEDIDPEVDVDLVVWDEGLVIGIGGLAIRIKEFPRGVEGLGTNELLRFNPSLLEPCSESSLSLLYELA